MSALAQSQNQSQDQDIQSQSVTSISAVARVDYILRFSKHAVLVVDEEMALCSSVGSQYLANLSDNQNAAYISMSAKLNNLQVRCRIIEQLFGNVLFDPEQSVAISLINLVKQHKQVVSIVIDNAHHLSLQLIHELTQLAEIAKKSNFQINVLMLALPQAGMTVHQHQSIFHKKLSIVSAQTGQLISHNDKLFKAQISWLSMTPFKKWMVFFASLVILSTIVVSGLYQRDVFSFTNEIPKIAAASKVIDNQTFAMQEQNSLAAKSAKTLQPELATASEIFLSVISESEPLAKAPPKLVENAKPQDIMRAIQGSFNLADTQNTVSESTQSQQQEHYQSQSAIAGDLNQKAMSDHAKAISDVKLSQSSETPIIKAENKSASTEESSEMSKLALEYTTTPFDSTVKPLADKTSVSLISRQDTQIVLSRNNNDDTAYFQNASQGFVIQIAAFSQENVLAEFLADYSEITFHQYQRLVNEKMMTVLTSQHFQTREQAEQALILLPQRIKERSPWIKTISVIKDEINQFQRSQSQINNVTIPTS